MGALLLRLHEATKSARRQESCTRPTTSHEATKPGTSTDGVSLAGDRQGHTRRGNPPRQQEPHTKNRRREPRRRPTTSYEARKSASTAGASHDTTCPPPQKNTPHRGTHASRRPVSHSNPTAHTENCGDKAFRTCPHSQSQQSAGAKPTQSQREASRN